MACRKTFERGVVGKGIYLRTSTIFPSVIDGSPLHFHEGCMYFIYIKSS